MFEGKKSIEVRGLFVAERIDLKGYEPKERLALSPLTLRVGEAGMALLFRYGAAVFIGTSPEEERAFLEEIAPRLRQPFESPESDTLRIRFAEESQEGIEGDAIRLSSTGMERLQVVAEILARSIVLQFYESRVSGDFDSIEQIASHLKRPFFRSPRMGRVLEHIGNSLMSLHKMVGRVEVTEKPELLWDHPELERLYAKLEDEYEIEERHRALERKLDLISRTAETVLDLLQTQRSIRVEWYIVILIVIEILLTLYELFVH